MDWQKMVGSFTSGMKDDSKSSNTEMNEIMGELGIALDEGSRRRDADYKDAFTNARAAADQGLAQREMAAGQAAYDAARNAGPAATPAPGMATNAAAPQGGAISPQQAAQAAMARQMMGPQNLGAPGPSAALQNVQVDPRTGLAGSGSPALPPSAGQLQAIQGAAIGGMQTPVAYPTLTPPNDQALMAAYRRQNGMI